jgi:hypothetical protein
VCILFSHNNTNAALAPGVPSTPVVRCEVDDGIGRPAVILNTYPRCVLIPADPSTLRCPSNLRTMLPYVAVFLMKLPPGCFHARLDHDHSHSLCTVPIRLSQAREVTRLPVLLPSTGTHVSCQGIRRADQSETTFFDSTFPQTPLLDLPRQPICITLCSLNV